MAKLYPFSMKKHAHDIEFRRNRVYNEMRDFEDGDSKISGEDYDKLYALHEELTELLLAVMDSPDGRVAWLTGKQYGLAKETVTWAVNERCSRNS